MGGATSRTVEIQISNNSRNFTLEKPRIHFFSGHSVIPPEPSVAPGSSSCCQFSNNTMFWGCNGLLVYEAEAFSLAIYFSNPIDYNRFPAQLGLELSPGKVHVDNLEETYNRTVKGKSDRNVVTHRVDLTTCQEPAQVCSGPVKVEATMSNAKRSVLRVEVKESGGNRHPQAREKGPGEVKSSGSPGGTSEMYLECRGRPKHPTGTPKEPWAPPEPHRHPKDPIGTSITP